MNTFKPFRELIVGEAGEDMDGKPVIQYANGDAFVLTNIDAIQRLVDCWNACRKLYSPAAHIVATEERVGRLEVLRKEAWARAVEFGANDFHTSEVIKANDNISDIADAIRSVREGMGWTQHDLAAAIGATQGSVSKWERGEMEPGASMYLAIMRLPE